MQAPGHILVIRLSALGDVAMTLPVLRKVSETYPELRFIILTRKFFAPIFEGIPNVEIFEADVKGRHKGLAGLKRLSKELKARKIDAVADLHNVLRSKILQKFFQLSGIPVKQIDKGRAEKKALTRKDKKVFRQLKSTHQRYAEVFAALGYPIELSDYTFPEKRTLSPAVRKIAGTAPEKWLGIAPFAQHNAKMYPQDLMKSVLRLLGEKENIKIFLFGAGEAEAAVLNQWEQDFPKVVNMAGKVSFKEELALISNLDAMLSMDSGNGHLAANYEVPVVTLWGLTHPYTGFAPFGQAASNSLLPNLEKYPEIPTSVYGNKVPDGYYDVMRTIPPENVVAKIEEVLQLS